MNTAVVVQLRAAIERALAPRSLEIVDDSARHAGHAGARAGGHFRVTLVAEAFRGRSPLERHRLVYDAVAPLMQDGVHALNIVARTPDET
jgi:BolA family transcriptional regulator, general stress-responsive regulator